MFKIISFITIFFITTNISSKTIKFEGVTKLSNNDLQTITSINIKDNNLEIDDINILLKELSLSQLIYEINYTEFDNHYLISIIESDLLKIFLLIKMCGSRMIY